MLAPSSITLSPISGNQISVNWAAVSNASEYTVERAEQADYSDAVVIYVGANTNTIDTGLGLNTTYYYRAMASKLTYCDSGWIGGNVTTETPESTDTDFLTYSFSEQSGSATIDAGAHTIDITAITGTDISALIATFTLSLGATCKISAVSQVSGITENDFTTTQTYTVTAEDGVTTQDWDVFVTNPPLFDSAEIGLVDNSTIAVYFTHNIVDGKTDGVHGVTSSAGNLSISSEVVSSGALHVNLSRDVLESEVISYYYEQGGANSLQDSEARLIDDFSVSPVTNNVTTSLLGPELITGSSWDTNGTWADNAGVLSATNEDDIALYDHAEDTYGNIYRLTFEVESITGQFQMRNSAYITTGQIDDIGQYSFDLDLYGQLVIDGNNSLPFTGSIKDISLKEILSEAIYPTVTGVVVRVQEQRQDGHLK
jgi:hypothetical protein